MTYFITAVRLFAVGILLAFAGSAAAQQVYPIKPIRFIVPYPPGGSTTNIARLVGQKLNEAWNQPVIIDNRGGADTIIGTEALAKSPADGYTIILVACTHVINSSLRQNLPYDAIKDFAAVATLTNTESILVAHPSLAANNLQELITLAKSRPGQLNSATVGSGTVTHLAGELFNIMVGVRIQNIPYKGTGQALTDLIGGQVQLSFNNPLAVIPHVKSGRLKAIAVSGERRLPALPQVPTFTEAGLPGFDAKNWFGVLAPAGTHREIIDKLAAEIARILAKPEVRETLINQGVEPLISTPAQFSALMKADFAKYADIIKTANIKLEN